MNDFIRRKLPFEWAWWGFSLLNGLVIFFHLLVLSQLIPFDIVWAGKLSSVEEMQVFESVSLLVNVVLLVILLVKGGFLKWSIPATFLNAVLWIFVAIFLLNSFGNLFSKTSLERYLATPLTLSAALLCYRLILGKETATADLH